jgi:hypothetical protein
MAGEALSNGTLVEVQTAPGPPIVYTAVGGIDGDFTAPGVLNEEIEVTGLDSTAREYIGGLSETGETSFQLMLRKEGTGPATANFQAGQEALKDLSVTRAIVSFRFTPPAGLTTERITCQGYVKEFRILAGSNTAVRAAVTIRWTGAPVYAV